MMLGNLYINKPWETRGKILFRNSGNGERMCSGCLSELDSWGGEW